MCKVDVARHRRACNSRVQCQRQLCVPKLGKINDERPLEEVKPLTACAVMDFSLDHLLRHAEWCGRRRKSCAKEAKAPPLDPLEREKRVDAPCRSITCMGEFYHAFRAPTRTPPM